MEFENDWNHLTYLNLLSLVNQAEQPETVVYAGKRYIFNPKEEAYVSASDRSEFRYLSDHITRTLGEGELAASRCIEIPMPEGKGLKLYIADNEKEEFIGQIIDTFEDFLEAKRIRIDNPEKNEAGNDDEETVAIIYGTDYGMIHDDIESTLKNWSEEGRADAAI